MIAAPAYIQQTAAVELVASRRGALDITLPLVDLPVVLEFLRMTERQKITMAKLLAIIETEFAQSLGRSVTEYMPRIRLCARAGEPNWNAEIGGDMGISVLGAFLVALDRVKAAYDLDADAREHLISGKR